MAGWMNTPLGTEVDLGTGNFVLDVVPTVCERGTAAPHVVAHVYCGHGRPSQLLLSSCSLFLNFPVAVYMLVLQSSVAYYIL